jgi:pimeloyl-ACP methyl ester carboxylesterase
VSLRVGQLRVSGIRSPVLEAGPPGAQEAVVFVHGNPGSSQDWVDLAQAVGAFGRTIALDMPGFGQADKPPDFDYTVAGYARHLAGALDQLGVRRAHLVLHDFGGLWELTWAIAYPEAFGSVTLINIGGPARLPLALPGPDLADADPWRAGHGDDHPARHAPAAQAWQPARPPPGAYRSDVRPFRSRHPPRRAVLKLYRASGDPAATARRTAEALRQVPCPALVVWGKHDPYVPVAFAERQREVFPDAQLVILEGSGHWPFADDPDGVARVVVPFLRQVMGHEAAGEPW